MGSKFTYTYGCDVTHWTYSTLKFIHHKKSASSSPKKTPEKTARKAARPLKNKPKNRFDKIGKSVIYMERRMGKNALSL